jgi:O-antigen/teichoic acid export membrane protein
MGFGVWSLVIQAILRGLINNFFLWHISKWMPIYGFSFTRLKVMFSYSSKILLSELINTLYSNSYLIIIGKLFSANILGFFTRASQFSSFPATNITGIISRVTFPVLSELQDNTEKLREAYKKIIKMSALIVFPLMLGLAALAEPTIITILTEKWRESIWMLQLLCFAMMWYPINAINLNVMKVKGRSDLFLKIEVYKKAFIVIVLIISVPLGIKAMIIGQIITSYIALFINLFYTKNLINYGFWKQMYDLLPILLLSFAMGVLIYGTNLFIKSNLIKLIVGLFEGLVFYIGSAWLFNMGEIREIPVMIKGLRKQ